MKKIISTIFLLAVLSACRHAYYPPVPAPSDPATNKLAEAAYSVSDSLLTLEAIKKVRNPGYTKLLPSPYILGVTQTSSVDWTGPIGPLVAKIAEAAHYHLLVLGNPPAIPIIVSINVRNALLGEILRDADFQAREKAQVYVYPFNKTIELRYLKC